LFSPWCLVFLISLIWQLSVPALAQAQPQGSSVPAPKQIVLLYSYGDGIPAYQQATRAFLSIMQEGHVSVNDLFFEYLDLERKKDIEHYKNLTTLFRHKYEGKKIDLIVTVHAQALRFILNEGKDLFPGTPALSYLAPETIETAGIERRFLLLPMRMDFGGTLELALRLFPETKCVVFINGIGEGEKRLEREAQGVFEQWRDKLQFEYTSDLSVEEMLQRIATLPPRTIIFYSNVFRDRTGRTFVPKNVADRVAKAANAPVFGMYNTILGSGIIGGSMFNFETEGARAGTLALDILREKLTLTKPLTILTASRTPMFDWEQLKLWGVKENRLPPGSIVLNRPKTLWSEYKGLVIVGIAVFLAQTVLVIGLLIQRNLKKKAEASVQQKTEELDQFFNVSLDLLCIANTDGYFLRLNPAWERTLGYNREELMAKRFLDFVHPDDLLRTQEAVSAQASQQRVIHFENRYRCKDGTYRWLEWNSASAGKLIYAAARDVTERKQAGETLRESEARLRDITFSMADWVWEVDENGVYTYSSQKGFDLLGRSREDVIGKTPFDFMPPDEAKRVAAIFSGIATNKTPIKDLENWNIRKNGESICLLTNGVPILDEEGNLKGYRGVDKDITEHKQAQETIMKAAEEWQATFDSVQDLVMILDPEFKLVRVNAATLSFFKLPLESILGNHCFTLMHGTSEPLEICPLAKMMKTKRHEETELYDEKRDAWFQVSVDPIVDGKAEIKRVIHTVKDITERKRAEAEVARARVELLHVERSLRLNQLTASLAHELNQPLAAILSNAQAALRFLKSDKPDLNEFQEIMQDIISDDQRAGNVIRSLRSMMKREEGEKKPIILNDVLNDVIQIFRSEAIFRNVGIETELDGSLPPVLGDRGQLQQVVLNIIMNGADAMSGNPPEHRKIIVRTKVTDQSIRMSVRDFGPGIDKENLERVFEPFFTTKRTGLGMGLALCHTIVEAHGGRIWAENSSDGGTTLFIELPIYESGN
jgi:PAS domain S-box-containing protein